MQSTILGSEQISKWQIIWEWIYDSETRCFSNFDVHMNPLEILLKCNSLISLILGGAQDCAFLISYQVRLRAGPWPTFWGVREVPSLPFSPGLCLLPERTFIRLVRFQEINRFTFKGQGYEPPCSFLFYFMQQEYVGWARASSWELAILFSLPQMHRQAYFLLLFVSGPNVAEQRVWRFGCVKGKERLARLFTVGCLLQPCFYKVALH